AAAKTGSAQDGRGYNYAWLAGVAWARAQTEDFQEQLFRHPALWRKVPKIAFAVVVENTSGHGGDIAAPIAADLLEAFFEKPKKEELEAR
ncbi:MAG: hypothetical protein D6805_05540, partial [Planctomycetota bacterium]